MAISSNPSQLEVKNEFGSNTHTSAQKNSLRFMLDQIFGSEIGSLRDFAGYGKPEITSVSATALDYDSIRVNFNVDVNNTHAYVAVQYTIGSFSSGVTTTSFTLYNSGGSSSRTINGLNPDTTYNFRVISYNDFNTHSSDRVISSTTSAKTDQLSSLPAPVISSAIAIGSGASITNIEVTFNYNNIPTSFSAQIDVGDGFGFRSIGVTNVSNVGTLTNPKKIRLNITQIINPTDYVQIRIRANAIGGYSASPYGSYVMGYLGALAPPTPTNISQPSAISGLVNAIWSNNHFDHTRGIRIRWYNGSTEVGSQLLSAGTTSASRTFSDGQSARFKVQYTSGQNTELSGYSDTENVQIFTQPTNLTYRIESDPFLGTIFYAKWTNVDSNTALEYARWNETNEVWLSTENVSAGTTERLQGTLQQPFRVRYVGEAWKYACEWEAPVIQSTSYVMNAIEINWTQSHEHGFYPADYDVQWSYNGSAYQNVSGVLIDGYSNFNSSKSGSWFVGSSAPFGETVDFRIRAKGGGGETSEWTYFDAVRQA